MTSQSPRIYIYKITFEEVPYYYYGVHKEKKFGEEYWGSPKTNKWCWDFYTPKKQILEIFSYTDEGWLEANLVENRLIKPVFNTDKWCLNESYGSFISMKAKRKSGEYCFKNKVGIHGYTKEQKQEIGRRNGIKNYINKKGIHALTTEQRKNNSSKNGKKCKELGTGVFSQSKEQLIESGKKGGQKTKELKLGIFGMTPEQKDERNKKASKIANSQRWECTETGYISNAGGLSQYQKKRGINTSKRRRIL